MPSAGAVPQDPNAVIAAQDCSADTGSRPPRVRSGWLLGEPFLRRRPVPTALAARPRGADRACGGPALRDCLLTEEQSAASPKPRSDAILCVVTAAASAPTPGVTTAGHRRADIQGLRAVAVAGVVAAHVAGWPGSGYLGVDVFFVISGFVITGVLLRDRQRRGRISLRAFYARRARRILPLALVVLALTVWVSAWALTAPRAAEVRTDALWAAFFLSNWHAAAVGSDYFALGDAPSPVLHFWSLGVEEQFYLVWPWLVAAALAVAARRWSGRGALGVLCASVVVASLGWAAVQGGTDATTAFYSSLTRAWELALGAGLACLPAAVFRLGPAMRTALSWAGLAVVAASFVVVADVPVPFPAALVPAVGALAVLAAGVGAPARGSRPPHQPGVPLPGRHLLRDLPVALPDPGPAAHGPARVERREGRGRLADARARHGQLLPARAPDPRRADLGCGSRPTANRPWRYMVGRAAPRDGGLRGRGGMPRGGRYPGGPGRAGRVLGTGRTRGHPFGPGDGGCRSGAAPHHRGRDDGSVGERHHRRPIPSPLPSRQPLPSPSGRPARRCGTAWRERWPRAASPPTSPRSRTSGLRRPTRAPR